MFWRGRYHACECIIGGNFNVNIDGSDVLASRIVDLVNNCRLIRCDDVFPLQKVSNNNNNNNAIYIAQIRTQQQMGCGRVSVQTERLSA